MRDRMQTVSRVIRPSAVGCWELRSMGLVDISRCCETCHSAERCSWGGWLFGALSSEGS